MGIDFASVFQYVKDNITLLAFLALIILAIVVVFINKTKGNQSNTNDVKRISKDSNVTINQNNYSNSDKDKGDKID